MKYYVTADVHGYYSELIDALSEQGFFEDNEPHKLIVCGDLFDRGHEALKFQEFLVELLEKDKAILIRGNHEDLAVELMYGMSHGNYNFHYNKRLGTLDTVLQLTRATLDELDCATEEIGQDFSKSPYMQTIVPAMLNYYETEHYIFTHGWIPCTSMVLDRKTYFAMPDWRNASESTWADARWVNGMEAAHDGVIEPDKTIVCGHIHASYGHSKFEGDGGEFDNNPNFEPYYSDGIIALDACTAFSGKVNVIVLED